MTCYPAHGRSHGRGPAPGRVEAGKMQCRPLIRLTCRLCKRLVEHLSATNAKCPITSLHGRMRGPGDEALLRHIFANLLSNAIKY